MRTTIALDSDIFAAAKSLAEAQGKTLGRVVSDLVRKALKPGESKLEANGFPVFEVSPNAVPMTPEGVRAALDDEF